MLVCVLSLCPCCYLLIGVLPSAALYDMMTHDHICFINWQSSEHIKEYHSLISRSSCFPDMIFCTSCTDCLLICFVYFIFISIYQQMQSFCVRVSLLIIIIQHQRKGITVLYWHKKNKLVSWDLISLRSTLFPIKSVECRSLKQTADADQSDTPEQSQKYLSLFCEKNCV